MKKSTFLIFAIITVLLSTFTLGVISSSGTSYTDGSYTVIVFRSNGTFNTTESLTAEVLMVGGGGSGGSGNGCGAGCWFGAGGGGAGGVLHNGSMTINAGNYTAGVGAGGLMGTATDVKGTNGGITTFNGVIVLGGGAGAANQTGPNGNSGGSGGGATYNAGTGGSGTTGQGNNGGANNPAQGAGAGGGGKNTTGQNNYATNNGGAGGNGTIYLINGSSVAYGGGGGGAAYYAGGTGGTGGMGGGGNGATGTTGGGNGTDGLGGGGGGSATSFGSKGGSGIIIIRYLTGEVPKIVFKSQEPSNVSLSTIFSGVDVNVTYNYTTANLTNPALNLTVFHNEGACYTFINGSCFKQNYTFTSFSQTSNYTSGDFTLISYSLNENDIIPRTGNLNQTHYTDHANYTLSNSNSYISTELLNVSTTETYNILEVGGYSSLNNSRVYACNSSYNHASTVETNANCLELGFIKSEANHSDDNLIPFTLINGKINNQLTATSIMYFLVRGANTGVNQVNYVNNFTRTGAIKTSNNGGVTFTNQVYTTLIHLHQLNGTEGFSHKGYGYYSGVISNTAFSSPDYIDLPPLAPTPPVILVPFNTNQSVTFMNISYTNATSTTFGVNISYYNITLRNSDLTLNRTIKANNSLFNNYSWNVFNENLTTGAYYVRVTAYDTLGSTSYDEEFFNLTRNAILNLTIIDGYTNASINYTNITLVDLTSGYTEYYLTNSSNTTIYVIKNDNYNLTINNETYALQSFNITPNSTNFNYLARLYSSNSVYFYVFNLNTNALINNTPVNILLVSGATIYNYTSTTGSYFASNITEGFYTATVSAENYSTAVYGLTILNRTTQVLNAFLLPSFVNIGFYTKSLANDPLYYTDIAIQSVVNGSYVTIANKKTDILGFSLFQLSEGTQYRFIMQPVGYTSKTFLMEVYSANSPYTINFQRNTLPYYKSFYETVSFNVFPENTTLTNQTYTFGISSYAINGTIIYTAMNCTGTGFNNASNVTGSPSGATASRNLDLSSFSGTLTCTYSLGVTGFADMVLVKNYFVGNYEIYTNANLINASNRLQTELNQIKSGSAWKAIIALFIILVIALTAHQLSAGLGKISVSSALAGVIVFAWLGWLPVAPSVFIVVIGAFITFYREF